jgi:hypothetical protein
MLHQPEKPGQIGRVDALFVKREDEIAGRGFERVVAVLDALGDAAERHHAADIEQVEKLGQGVIGDFGINGHARR